LETERDQGRQRSGTPYRLTVKANTMEKVDIGSTIFIIEDFGAFWLRPGCQLEPGLGHFEQEQLVALMGRCLGETDALSRSLRIFVWRWHDPSPASGAGVSRKPDKSSNQVRAAIQSTAQHGQ
jgi:hypothetical protein